ncbi:MAG: ferredoxin [Candidatus Thermoplasmatota archaeon]|nr:ferredoxin [Candidatus Thermoplasmatota archaeon]
MKNVTIDQDTCIACGMCESTCPQVFSVSGNPNSTIVPEFQEGEDDKGRVPEEIPCLDDAEENCPVDAIKVE